MHKIYPEEAGASKTLIELMNYMQTWVGSVNTTDTTGQGTREAIQYKNFWLLSFGLKKMD